MAWFGLHPAARRRSPRRAQVLGRLSSTGFGGSLPKKFKGQIGLWRLCSLRWQLSKKDWCEQSAAPPFQTPAFLPAAAGAGGGAHRGGRWRGLQSPGAAGERPGAPCPCAWQPLVFCCWFSMEAWRGLCPARRDTAFWNARTSTLAPGISNAFPMAKIHSEIMR